MARILQNFISLEKLRAAAETNALDFNRRTLAILGLHLSTGDLSLRDRSRRRLLPVFNLFRIGCVIALEAMSIAHAWGDTSMAVEFTIIIIFYVHIGVKYACLFLNRVRVRAMLVRLEDLTLALVAIHRTNAAILKNTDLLCYRVNRYPTGLCVCVIAASLTVLTLYSWSAWDIPFFLWFPYDAKASPAFEVTLTLVFLNFLFDLVTIVLCDAAAATTLLQVAGQLKMLSSDIRNAKQITDDNARRARQILANRRKYPNTSRMSKQDDRHCFGSVVPRPSLRAGITRIERSVVAQEATLSMGRMEESMKTNVKHHQQIISLVREIQTLFNPILAEQILFNALLGVVGLYVGTLSKTTFIKTLVMSSCILGGILELSVVCWTCDSLKIASVSVFEATYSCDWLEQSAAFKRSLRLLMTRAQKDIVIKAAGVTVSRITFRTMCKVAYYFQSLLNKMYNQS